MPVPRLTPRLSQMRWKSFQYDRKFAAIVMTAATIELIPEFDTACAVLRRFHDHLQPGGRLILDISPDDSFTSDPEIRRWTTSEGDLLTLLELPDETGLCHAALPHALSL